MARAETAPAGTVASGKDAVPRAERICSDGTAPGPGRDQTPGNPPDLGSWSSFGDSSSTLTSLKVTTRTDFTKRAGR